MPEMRFELRPTSASRPIGPKEHQNRKIKSLQVSWLLRRGHVCITRWA